MWRENYRCEYEMNNEKEEVVFALCIVTSLMPRATTRLRQASELIFMDSTSNLDELKLRFFIIWTYSTAGGLPLGFFITNNETELTITTALNCLIECMCENAFFGHGRITGPRIVITDNNNEERSSLNVV